MPRDIEEFLKMAAQRRQQQRQKGKAAGIGRPPARQAPADPSMPSAEDPIIILSGGTPGPNSPPEPQRQTVAEHVRAYIDTSDVTEVSQQLGEEVALADDKMDARLHRTFDHSVGHLPLAARESAFATTTTTTAKQVSPAADALLGMLSHPESIQQAILLSEILKRPSFDDE